VTNAVHDRTGLLQQVLEEQFEVHTGRLPELLMGGALLGAPGPERGAAPALTTSSRQELTDIAHALRRMADGSYGTCEFCRHEIPIERLESLPQARYCLPCESRRVTSPVAVPPCVTLQEVSRAKRS
jgi:DnaK suppressor protein